MGKQENINYLINAALIAVDSRPNIRECHERLIKLRDTADLALEEAVEIDSEVLTPELTITPRQIQEHALYQTIKDVLCIW